jgi:hypothetical protein
MTKYAQLTAADRALISTVAAKYAAQMEIKVVPAEQLATQGTNAVNYIRHKLTPYEKLMDATRNKPNGFLLRDALRVAVLIAIGRAYAHMPQVAQEAMRQVGRQTYIHNREGNIVAWSAAA